MEHSNDRDNYPIVGVVAHNYLREVGMLSMRHDVRVAYFGPADSALHRIADYGVPTSSLDFSEDELRAAVDAFQNRVQRLAGLISLRDPNVVAVANVARELFGDRVGPISGYEAHLRQLPEPDRPWRCQERGFSRISQMV